MNVNNVQQDAKQFVEKWSSPELSDLEYSVNQYFESNAVLTHDLVYIQGASKIKKLLRANMRENKAKLTQEPRYDSSRQILTFSTRPWYKSPTLPSYIPFHKQLSDKRWSQEFKWTAHLAPNNDEQGDGGAKGQTLYITKLEGQQVGGASTRLPAFLKPLASFLSIAFATIFIFFRDHQNEGILQLVVSAFAELFNAFWSTLLSESSRRQAQAEQWRSEKAPQLKQYYEQAYASANQAYSQAVDISSKVRADVEARAKSAGIPIDDYKQRATQAIADLTENVEARAKAAGLPVDEYKKQAEALIEDLKRRAGEAAGYADEQTKGVQEQAKGAAKEAKGAAEGAAKELKKKGDSAKDSAKKSADSAKKSAEKKADEVTQDAPASTNGHSNGEVDSEQREKEIRAEFAQTPKTPLGGHDPTAPNAPSFAEAAAL